MLYHNISLQCLHKQGWTDFPGGLQTHMTPLATLWMHAISCQMNKFIIWNSSCKKPGIPISLPNFCIFFCNFTDNLKVYICHTASKWTWSFCRCVKSGQTSQPSQVKVTFLQNSATFINWVALHWPFQVGCRD